MKDIAYLSMNLTVDHEVRTNDDNEQYIHTVTDDFDIIYDSDYKSYSIWLNEVELFNNTDVDYIIDCINP